MQTVYKYGLGRKNNVAVDVSMPEGAVPIHADYDPGTNQFAVWAVVLNDVSMMKKRTFYISGSGHDLALNLTGDEEMLHLGSFMTREGRAVGWFHAFEVVAADKK